MKIQIFRTALCPRCLMASRALKKIAASNPDLEIETIEVATNLTRTRQAGIKALPTIVMADKTLSSLILSEKTIRRFIEEHLNNPA